MTESELKWLQSQDPSMTGIYTPVTGGGEDSDAQEYDPNAVGLAANNIPAGKTVDEIMGPFGSGGNPQDFDPSITGTGAVYAPLSPDAQAQAIKNWNDSYQNMMQDIANSNSMSERRQKVRYYRATGQLDAYKKSGLPVVNDLNYLGASDEDNEGRIALAPEAPSYVDSTADTDNPIGEWYIKGKNNIRRVLKANDALLRGTIDPNVTPEEFYRRSQESADAHSALFNETVRPAIAVAEPVLPAARVAMIPFKVMDMIDAYNEAADEVEQEERDGKVPKYSKVSAGVLNALGEGTGLGDLYRTFHDPKKFIEDLKDEDKAREKAFELMKLTWKLAGGKGKRAAPAKTLPKGPNEIEEFNNIRERLKTTGDILGTKKKKEPKETTTQSVNEIMGPYGSDDNTPSQEIWRITF